MMMIMKIIRPLDDSVHLTILARLNPEPAIPPSLRFFPLQSLHRTIDPESSSSSPPTSSPPPP